MPLTGGKGDISHLPGQLKKKGALWVLRLMVEDGEKVGKWHFLDWKWGKILLHLGCSECRKDIFEEISI